MHIHQAKELLQRYRAGNCTSSEKELIETWYKQLIDTGEWQWDQETKEIMQQLIEARIMAQITDEPNKAKTSIPRLPRSRRWAAAAAVIFLLSISGHFLFHNKTIKPAPIAKVQAHDVKAPRSNIAIVTLASGQKIFLDSVGNGALAMQGNVKLIKLASGKIVYQPGTDGVTGKMEYNTLLNPRGSKVIDMTLADGSKVWLNAGSSLSYPVSFIGNERKVSITGEAYFEVIHDASKPFIVSNGAMNIKVLGTHFNVNTFQDDDNIIKVTLLQGSVKIDNGKATGLLKPGQQARVNNEVNVVSDVDLDMVMAWKNGYFQFDNASLQNVLKQISRWYDVDVHYEGKIQPREFVGEMQRDLNLSEMLNILAKNNVRFRIEGKELIVMPD